VKHQIPAIIVSAVFGVPVASFAQNQPVTRAQVRAELIQLEKAGYNPSTVNRSKYPTDIQAAEARVAAQNGATSYAPAVSGSSQ
jgi:hypothetical protein